MFALYYMSRNNNWCRVGTTIKGKTSFKNQPINFETTQAAERFAEQYTVNGVKTKIKELQPKVTA